MDEAIIYIIDVVFDVYEGAAESYVFLSREEADKKFDDLVREHFEKKSVITDCLHMYAAKPGDDYTMLKPIRAVGKS